MYYVGIDLGLHLGYAVLHDCQLIESGTHVLGKRADDSAICNLRDFLEKLLASYYPVKLGFEDVKQQHRSKAAAKAFGAYWAILALVCYDLGVESFGFGVHAIKKFASGKGNAIKDDMIDFVKNNYDLIVESDEADAICISLLTTQFCETMVCE